MTPDFPFETRRFRTSDGEMAYTDVGRGKPVLFLHGNPTWAYLYRHLIGALSSEVRCIAPDYLGFGRSDKPAGISYRPRDHAARVDALVHHLDLQDITLVVHDWGGPIGTSLATRDPDRFRRIVVFNTWAWPLDADPWIGAFSRLAGGSLGRVLIRRYNAFARWVVPLAFADRTRLSANAFRAYVDPLDTPDRRMPSWVFPQALRTETDWLRAIWSHRHRLRDLPALILWGTRDPAFGAQRYLQRWTSLFDAPRVHQLDVGHYVPEEAGPEIVPQVRRFVTE